ncbi:MAG: MBL fold metallo-hydrolase [Bacteroidetes bacterium]|nr:MAG: MBL fold metallo-hydrolase [Bacteroidota bacterium]
MKFTFTGTGTSQGVPVIACPCAVCHSADPRDNRLRTSGLLSDGKTTLSFDAGPDFRQQMLRHAVKELDAIVFTHPHKDHVAGLDDVRAYNYLHKRKMPVFANRETINHLKREFFYIFENPDYPGVPQLDIQEIADYQSFSAGDIHLKALPVMHASMKVFAFRIGSFAYVTDANVISDQTLHELKGLEVLVINALRHEKHYSHFNLAEAIEVVQKLKPARAYLTHISHQMGLHSEVSETLPPGIELAWDGLEIELTSP